MRTIELFDELFSVRDINESVLNYVVKDEPEFMEYQIPMYGLEKDEVTIDIENNKILLTIDTINDSLHIDNGKYMIPFRKSYTITTTKAKLDKGVLTIKLIKDTNNHKNVTID